MIVPLFYLRCFALQKLYENPRRETPPAVKSHNIKLYVLQRRLAQLIALITLKGTKSHEKQLYIHIRFDYIYIRSTTT